MKSLLGCVICLLCAVSVGAQTGLKPPKEAVFDRFLRYVKIDTQSAEDQPSVPSTRKQLNLAKNPQIKHGTIAVAFTPDDAINLQRFADSEPLYRRGKLSWQAGV